MGVVVALRPRSDQTLEQSPRALECAQTWLDELGAVSGQLPSSLASQRTHLLDTLGLIAEQAATPLPELPLAACTRETISAALAVYRNGPDRRFTTNPQTAPARRSDNSVARRLSTLRMFFRWCQRTGLLHWDPTCDLEPPPQRIRVPKALEVSQALDLMTAATLSSWPARDTALVAVALGSGPRLAELAGMNLVDLIGGSDTVAPDRLLLRGKGDKHRIVPLTSRAQQALQVYLVERSERLARWGQSSSGVWLVSRPWRKAVERDPRLSREGMADVFARLLEYAGLRQPGLRVHVTRHTAATALLRSKAADVRVVQELLGHASLSTTAQYLKVTGDDLRLTVSGSPLG